MPQPKVASFEGDTRIVLLIEKEKPVDSILAKPDQSQFASSLAMFEAEAKSMTVKTPDDCLKAKTMMQQVRRYVKDVHAKLDPFVQMAKNAYDDAKAERAKWIDPAERVDDTLSAMVKTFEREEREAAQREQDKKNAENARLAREKADAERKERERLAKEQRETRVKEITAMQKRGEIGKREASSLLKQAGALEEAAIEEAAAEAEAAKNAPAPQVTVKPNIPKVAGVPSQIHYYAEVTNAQLLVNAYEAAVKTGKQDRASYLRQFITANGQKLGEEARAVKNSDRLNAAIPGVRFYED